MKFIIDAKTVTKLSAVLVFTASLAAVSLVGGRMSAVASSDGPPPSFTSAPGEANCSACHASNTVNDGLGSIQISGVPANYAPGQQIQLTVTMARDDATIYGFQMTAIDSTGVKAGTFSLPAQVPAELQLRDNLVGGNLMRQYIEHTTDGIIPTQLGSKAWRMMWTAPAQSVGRVDFYAAGNAADSDNSPSGDYIYTGTAASVPATSFAVGGRVVTPAGVGVRSAFVFLTGPNGVTINALTNSSGFYNFADVPAGVSYSARVASKRYRFPTRTVTVNGELTDINFTGLE
jgi:hypothetical protein